MQLAHEAPFRLGAMEVRPAERRVAFDGREEVVEPRVMEVLVHLVRAGGEVVSKDDLIAACWEGRAVTDDAINRVISRLRRVSELTGGRDFTVETITKVGYRLTVAPARVGTTTAPAPAKPKPAAPTFRAFRLPRPSLLAAALVLVATIISAGAWGALSLMRPSADAPLTLAVLPFDDVGRRGQFGEVVADGLPRDIRARVSRVRGLRVIGDASSALVASERGAAPDQIGWRLGADLVLDGSVRIEGESLRATAELVDAATGAIAWTQTYDGPASDIAAAEGALSSGLLEYLVQRLGPNRIEALTPPRAVDRDNHRKLLEVRLLLRQVMASAQSADFRRAGAASDEVARLLAEILAREPDNAEALVLMSHMVQRRVGSAGGDAPGPIDNAEGRAQAADLLRQALRADPDNPAALTALAEQYRRFDWRWDVSERLLRRAIAIDPNFSDAHVWLTYLLTTTGRCVEAVEHARIAAELDPAFTWRRLGVPRALACAGQWSDSDAYYLFELDRDRENLFLVREMHINAMMRRDADYLRDLAGHIERDLWAGAPPQQMTRLLDRMSAGADALDGRPSRLLRMIEEDERRVLQSRTSAEYQGRLSTDVMWTLAIEAAAAGDSEHAIDMLEYALNGRTLYIPQTIPHGEFAFSREMRASPRYQALWRRDAQLADLLDRRLSALRDRQMTGYDEKGRRITARRIRIDPPGS